MANVLIVYCFSKVLKEAEAFIEKHLVDMTPLNEPVWDTLEAALEYVGGVDLKQVNESEWDVTWNTEDESVWIAALPHRIRCIYKDAEWVDTDVVYSRGSHSQNKPEPKRFADNPTKYVIIDSVETEEWVAWNEERPILKYYKKFVIIDDEVIGYVNI